MQSSSPYATTEMPETPAETATSRRNEDLIYQAMTVAAILLVLGSLWLF